MPAAEDIYLFRHAVLRDAAYELQLPIERAKLHATAFQVMEAGVREGSASSALEMADHAMLGGLGEKELVYLTTAASLAEDAFQFRVALRCWDRVRQHCLVDDQRRLEAEFSYARAAFMVGDYARAHALLSELELKFEQEGRVTELQRVRLNQMSALIMNQSYAEAYAKHHNTVEMALRETKPGAMSKILNNWALVLKAIGRPEEAEEYLRAARADALVVGDTEMAEACLANLANLHRDRGENRAAKEILEGLLARARARDDQPLIARLQANFAWCLRSMHENDAAEEAARDALATARAMGIVPIELTCLRNLAGLAKDRGDTEASVRFHEEAARGQAEVGNLRELAHNCCALAGAYAFLGRDNEAARQIEYLARLARVSADPKVAELAAGARGHSLSSAGDAKGALAAFRDAWRKANETKDARAATLWSGNAALAMLRLGQLDDAKRGLMSALEQATAVNGLFQRSWWQFGLAAHAELSGDATEAETRALAALEDLKACMTPKGVPVELAMFAKSIARIENDTGVELGRVRRVLLGNHAGR